MRIRAAYPAALAAGALLATVTGAVAQVAADAPAAAPALPPQYEVEVIVFAYRDFDPTEERFEQTPNGVPTGMPGEILRDVPVFDETTFGATAPGTPAAPTPEDPLVDPLAAAPLDPLAEALRVRPLRPEELKLGTEYRRIRAIGAYEPLLHGGWVQPGLPDADAQPFDLALLGAVNPRGTVRVHLSRFLHITLDLTYQSTGVAAEPTATFGDALGELTLAPRYRLTTTRSARSGELHYFDHPAFGVLVRVTPLPTQDASTPRNRPAA
jgi:hypothetical protein